MSDTKRNSYLGLYATVIGTFKVKFTLLIWNLFLANEIEIKNEMNVGSAIYLQSIHKILQLNNA